MPRHLMDTVLANTHEEGGAVEPLSEERGAMELVWLPGDVTASSQLQSYTYYNLEVHTQSNDTDSPHSSALCLSSGLRSDKAPSLDLMHLVRTSHLGFISSPLLASHALFLINTRVPSEYTYNVILRVGVL